MACTSLALHAADQVTATLTITGVPTPGNYAVFSGGDMRMWSNSYNAHGVLTTNTTGWAATNLVAHTMNYPLGSAWIARNVGGAVVAVDMPAGSAGTITLAGGWAGVTYATQNVNLSRWLSLPATNITNLPLRTNMASQLVDWFVYSTNAAIEGTLGFTNFVTRAATQTLSNKTLVGGGTVGMSATSCPAISGNVVGLTNGLLVGGLFSNGVVAGASRIAGNNLYATNGDLRNVNVFSTNVTAATVEATNLIVRGGIKAPGAGSGSLLLAPPGMATASGAYAVMVGNSGSASGGYSISLNGTADGMGSVAINGPAKGLQSVSINGTVDPSFVGSASADDAIAIGGTAGHDRSVAIGKYSQSSRADQITFGTGVYETVIPGYLNVGNMASFGSITNPTFTGVAITAGRTCMNIGDVGELAAGVNLVDLPSNTVVNLSFAYGPFGLVGINPPAAGDMRILHNGTSYDITIENEHGVAAADQRIRTGTGTDIIIPPDAWFGVMHDGSRWSFLWASTRTNLVNPPLGLDVMNTNAYMRLSVLETNGLTNHWTFIAPATSNRLYVTVGTNAGWNSNSTMLAIDSANKRVGIGTNNPRYDLEVAGGGNVLAQTAFFIGNPSAGKAGLFKWAANDTAYLGTWSDAKNYVIGGSSVILNVSESGGEIATARVGIGTNSPQARFHLMGTIRTDNPGNGTPVTPGTVAHWIPWNLNGTNGFVPFYK